MNNRKPQKLNTDQGTEFTNKQFQNFLNSENIKFFVSVGDSKAAICERFNRTLKEKMWKYFRHNSTNRYIDVLQNLVDGYNNAKHRSIGMSPNEVNTRNESKVWKYLRKDVKKPKKRNTPKFFTGEHVRLNLVKGAFGTGYTGRWTNEIFTIDKVYDKFLPYMYRIKDSQNETIKGRYYENEMQRVKVSEAKTYKIEKILKYKTVKGKKQAFVKWEGYPDSANSWIPASDIENILTK